MSKYRRKKKSNDGTDDEASVGTINSLPVFPRKSTRRADRTSKNLAHAPLSTIEGDDCTESTCETSEYSSSIVKSESSNEQQPNEDVTQEQTSGCNHASCHVSMEDALRSVVAVLGGILGKSREKSESDEKESRTTSGSSQAGTHRSHEEKREGIEPKVLSPRCSIDDDVSVDLEYEVPDMQPRPGSKAILPAPEEIKPLCSCNETHKNLEQDKITIKNLSRSNMLRSQRKMSHRNRLVHQVKTGVLGIDSFGKPMPLSIIKAKHTSSELPQIEETNE